MYHGRISLNSVLLLLLVNFVSGFRLESIYVYTPHRKYQVEPHSSPWFSAACAAVIVHRNHFFRLYEQNKSSESNIKFGQTGNRCKRLLEAAKLAYATKTKKFIFSQKRGSWDFWRIANSVNLLFLLYSTAQRSCLLHLIKRVVLIVLQWWL